MSTQTELLAPSSVFNLFDPTNMLVFISVFSPVILILIIVSSSIVFGYEKGMIYLGFLLASTVVREVYYHYNSPPAANDDMHAICKSVRYGSSNSNSPLFSAFVFSFTIMYLAFPMYNYGASNFPVFASLIVFLFFDLFVKLKNRCVLRTMDLFVNVLGGSILALSIVSLMIHGGSGKFLFFNEISSNKEICSRPAEQTFKCAVYKNGELIGGL